MAAALYGAAALLMAWAPELPYLLGARVLYGLGIGFAMHAAPAYIAGAKRCGWHPRCSSPVFCSLGLC